MNRFTLALLIVSGLMLSSCGTVPSDINTIHTNQAAPVPVVQPNPMVLGTVVWKVYDLAGLKALVAQLEASGKGDTVVYVMTKNNYDILAMNLAEMKRYIADQKAENVQLREAITINAGVPAEAAPAPAPKKHFWQF